MSNKVLSADNQQERLINVGWIVGFVDGEGCFSVGFVKQPDRKEAIRLRRGYKTGFQVFHEFAVTQGEKSKYVLYALKDFFGVGNVYVNRRYDNHKEYVYRYVVRKRQDLLNVIIPFFEKYELRTSKHNDFEKFAQSIQLLVKGEHLSHEGLIKIAEIASTMNRMKQRDALIRILRDHTSTSAHKGEEMVRTVWRHTGSLLERRRSELLLYW